MERSCPPCSSSFNGEEEEETKSSSRLLWVPPIPPELDLPSEDRGDDRRSNPLANGAVRQNDDHETTNDRPQGYTSLRDLLPLPCVSSPTAAARPQETEISIRNRLVKQAAYAYLQPTGVLSPSSSRRRGCLGWLTGGCLGFVGACLLPAIRRTFGRLLARFRRRAVRGR